MCLRQRDNVGEPFISGCNRLGFSEAKVEIIWDGRYLTSIDAEITRLGRRSPPKAGMTQKDLWQKQPTKMTLAGQTRLP